MSVYFVTGIDTDVGKSYATAFFANYLKAQHSANVITQKLVQTGNVGISADIITHRRLMHMPLTDADLSGITCPYVFEKAASPHLACALAGQTFDPKQVTKATQELLNCYDTVVIEGAGGLIVPLIDTLTSLDFIKAHDYPVVLVTCGRLGSINHTLLTLQVLSHHHITLSALIYNSYFDTDPQIVVSTRDYLKASVKSSHPDALWLDCPVFEDT